LELDRLLSLGALVSESLSTRLDSVRAPDLLCVDEERLDPDARLRELALERLFGEDRLFDLDEELRDAPERLLLVDRDFRLGIPPSPPGDTSIRVRRLPGPGCSNPHLSG
jgi:hypothetical protein